MQSDNLINLKKNDSTSKEKFNHGLPVISKYLIPITWLVFLSCLSYIIYFFPNLPQWQISGAFEINGLSIVIWTVVTFFSAIVQTYSASYMKGFKKQNTFLLTCLLFSISVMFFVASSHVALLLLFWLSMGILMSKLIGINKEWNEAKQAASCARKNYFVSALFLSIGVLLLAFQSDAYTINEILSKIDELPVYVNIIASVCIIVAALIQSAIFPFHKWLLSAMTSPTPASALMHAGFVNGAGILLAIFAPLLFKADILLLIFIIGGVTAIISQFTKLLQVNVKQKLACSTSAQMSFMILQCGLGFFSAAITHLILHGFYKAYLFLSAGEEIENSAPKNADKIVLKPLQTLFILVTSALGGVLFAIITGKGTAFDSGLFLTFIVAITVGQVTYNIINKSSLSSAKKLIVLPILIIAGITFYGLCFNGVTLLMSDMAFTNTPVELTSVHIGFGVIFLIAFYIMLFGIYRKIPWLYVKLLNNSQPYGKSILSFKN
ncbi:proton-conducting transporter membrane subunit [Algibacter aquimarinus]|uniref:NADH dehydrogenase n=1 Tax=Algibacter aquimarinus TaxID=1136748 RepID=A0ABP9HL28_9FLAO